MKKIALSKGLFALVDDSDYGWLSRFKWYASTRKTGSPYAARTHMGFKGRPTNTLMHRQIMSTPSRLEIDHKDGNGLNNQRSNLRVATRNENSWNSRPSERRAVKGVTFQGHRLTSRPWQARIAHNGTQMHLGYFPTKTEAAYAYNAAAIRLFGEFAKLNRTQFIKRPSDNRLRMIISRGVVEDKLRGKWLICRLGCGHVFKIRYCKRGKIGSATHCKECK